MMRTIERGAREREREENCARVSSPSKRSLRDIMCCHRIRLAVADRVTLIRLVGLLFAPGRVTMIFQSVVTLHVHYYPSIDYPRYISALESFRARWRKARGVALLIYRLLYDTRNNDLPRNSYYCVLDDFRLFIFYLLCKIYNTNSILETLVSCIFSSAPVPSVRLTSILSIVTRVRYI